MIPTDNTRGHLHVHSAVFFVMKDLWPTFVIANKFTGKLGFFHYVSGIQHSMEKAEGCKFYLFDDPTLSRAVVGEVVLSVRIMLKHSLVNYFD